MTVNKDRLYRRLLEVAEPGKEEDGIHCLALSPQEMEALTLVKRQMGEAGLTVRTDLAGNLVGRREGEDPSAPVVMTGSHIDTVYGGGAFDGRLGVIGAIEALQCMEEQGIKTKHPIEVYAYRDEEGTRFVGSYSGARWIVGTPLAGILDHKDKDGLSVRDCLAECGVNPDTLAQAALPPGYAKAHLELHIEQGAVLERENLAVGVVTGICCQVRGEFTVTGQASHAGTTPMEMRNDALCAAAKVISAIEDLACEEPGCVATVGRIAAYPGGVNVIPGEVKFSLDIRHQEPRVRDRVLERICARAQELCGARGASCELKVLSRVQVAKPCDPEVMGIIEEACGAAGQPVFRLASGAGHDSGAFAPFCPYGMIFVRTKDGISHNRDEYASPEDCAAGAEVLYHTLLKLAERV